MSGHIQKRGKSYYLTVSKGYDHNGKQIKYTKTVKNVSKAEAKLILAEFAIAVEKNDGTFTHDKNITLSEFINYWWNEYVVHNHAPQTQEWQKYLMTRVIPVLGHIKLSNLKPTHLLSFYNSLHSTSLSVKTIRMHHSFLSSVLGKAEKWQFISTNPCRNVEPPRPKQNDITIFTEDELKKFLQLLENEPIKYKLFFLLTLSTGLRRGETIGLTWDKIDFKNATITVSQTVQYVGKQVICKKPKTEKSIRTLAISNTMVNLFRVYEAEQNSIRVIAGSSWRENGFIFTQNNGRPMFPSTVYTWLRRMLKHNNLPAISVHAFRHMSATLLLSTGANIKSVSARLGHTKVSTTTDIYAHSLQSADRDNANKMEALIKASLDTDRSL